MYTFVILSELVRFSDAFTVDICLSSEYRCLLRGKQFAGQMFRREWR
jgi:hypothetical protein